MHYFNFKKNSLYCENIKVSDLADKYGTPLYVYSARTIVEHFLKIKKAFASLNPLICYSVKANSNLSILKLLMDKGSGLDIVSGGELYRAKKVKCPGKRIVYASVGKTDQEIIDAVNYGILLFNIESLPELTRVNQIAAKLNRKVKVALRINPDIEAKTHKYITTGKKETKFGMDVETVRRTILNRGKYPNLNMAGIHIHIGSQITQGTAFVKAIKKVTECVLREVAKKGVSLEYFDIGGGLGIIYDKEKPQTAQQFASKVVPLLKKTSLKIILEPGRFIVGNAGILVSKVLYVKDTPSKKFIIVDSGMNDLIRPSLYDAYQKIVSVKGDKKAKKKADIVGPICESGDFLGKGRYLDSKQGDYLAVLGSGAYGFSMSSNYNSRPRPAEILVKGSKSYLIRKREDYKDLLEQERIV